MRARRSIVMLGRRIPVWALVLSVLAVVAVAALVVTSTGAEGPAHPRVSISSFEVDDAPQAVAAGPSGTWVVSGGDRTVQLFDSDTGAVAERFELARLPGGIALGDDAIWVGFIQGNEVVRIDPAAPRARRMRRIEVGRTPQSIARGSEAIWVAAFDDGSIWKIGEDEGPDIQSFELEDAFPSAIATGSGSVWITDVVANTLIRMDEVTGTVTEEIAVGDSPTAVAVGEGGVWVANYNDATVTHIDPATNETVGRPIIIGGRPGGITAGEGYVWVTRPESDSVIRIDPVASEWTGEVFEVGEGPQGIDAGRGSVWVADQGSDTVTRLTLQR